MIFPEALHAPKEALPEKGILVVEKEHEDIPFDIKPAAYLKRLYACHSPLHGEWHAGSADMLCGSMILEQMLT